MAAKTPHPKKRARDKHAAFADEQAADAWDEADCEAIIEQLWTLRGKLLAYEASLAPHLEKLDPGHRTSARNLAHYLRLRQSDRRPLQESLAKTGLPSEIGGQ